MNSEVIMIPIDRIRILNPRHRDKRKFELIVQSIKNLGLKKPIQVSLRSLKDGEGCMSFIEMAHLGIQSHRPQKRAARL